MPKRAILNALCIKISSSTTTYFMWYDLGLCEHRGKGMLVKICVMSSLIYTTNYVDFAYYLTMNVLINKTFHYTVQRY